MGLVTDLDLTALEEVDMAEEGQPWDQWQQEQVQA